MAWPVRAKEFILDQPGELQAQQQAIDQLHGQLSTLASELASLRKRISRSSRNSSKPPSNNGPGFKPPERRKRGGQPDLSGSGPELLPIERVDEVVEHHHPDACRLCGTFLGIEGIEPANNAAERALRQSVIQRKVSNGVHSRQGAICRSRLLTVTTTLRQQGRDIWQFLKQTWIAHHRGGEMPSLLPDH